jgi:nucleoid DNA-binding protein
MKAYKKNKLKRNEFFEEIVLLADFCDRKLVENVYYALIKVISRQLRAGRRVKLPDWGRFHLHDMAPKQCLDVNSGKVRNMSMKKCVKFEPDYKVKAYFRQI